jgi:hypothetical protein
MARGCLLWSPSHSAKNSIFAPNPIGCEVSFVKKADSAEDAESAP